MMTNRVNSSIFDDTWHDKIYQAKANNANMTISDIEGQVWIPTFEHCQSLLDQLQRMSINLSDVDKYFSGKPSVEVEAELKALSSGVSMCLEETCDTGWIQQSLKKIMEYLMLCSHSAAAHSFLRLKDLLHLTKGDFSAVEKIAVEVGYYTNAC